MIKEDQQDQGVSQLDLGGAMVDWEQQSSVI